MRNYTETCKANCSYILTYNFFIYLLPLKSYVFVASFSNAFYPVNESFPKGTCLYGNVRVNGVFHMKGA